MAELPTGAGIYCLFLITRLLTPSISHQGLELLTVCWPSPATSPRQLPQPPPRKSHVWHIFRSGHHLCVCLLSVGGVTWRQRPWRVGQATVNVRLTFPITAQTASVCLKTIFSHKFSPRRSALIKVLSFHGGEQRFTHFGRTWEVKQAMRGAISLHHISLIHFLVEWLKLPAMRNVGQRGRLSGQRAAGKQTKQKNSGNEITFSEILWPVRL